MNAPYTTEQHTTNLVTTERGDGSYLAVEGQILFDETSASSIFQVLSGEVLVLRNGQVVDLVQAGELLDSGIWDGATAVAWTRCVLQTITMKPQPAVANIALASMSQHFPRSLFSVN